MATSLNTTIRNNMPAQFIPQGIGQPYYGSNIYGSTVYDSAYPDPATQAIGWPAFFQAIASYLTSTNTFSPGSCFWAIDPDSVIQWPAGPTPFGLVVPGRMEIAGDDIGGGRYSKLWTVRIDIHIVVSNVYDTAFQDTSAVTSTSLMAGPYALIHLVTDKFDQAYIKTQNHNYATVEFPRAVEVGDLHRFKQTNSYVSIPITFEMTVLEEMASTWLPGGTPPSSEDF